MPDAEIQSPPDFGYGRRDAAAGLNDAEAAIAPRPHLIGVGCEAFGHDEVVAHALHLQELQEVISPIARSAAA